MTFSRSTYTTTRALTYSYIHILPQHPTTRYFLFLHGFPFTSHCWRHQVSFFKDKGYGIIVPDLLGFGETSRPTELEMYRGEDMARDIVEILMSEGIGIVVGVAHDWGCFLLSRLANYHPERFSAYAYIDHGYMAPGRGLTTAASESVESLYFTTNEEIIKKYKGALGGIRSWLTEGKTTNLPAYLTSEDHKHYEHAFSKGQGGYGPAINWYRAALRNINEEDERSMEYPPLCLVSLPLLCTRHYLDIALWHLRFHILLTPNQKYQRLPTS
ncbi:hypothetical protein HG530_013726 [Fusarium avenaceum]|nr:hypothetical protein HG530_013726 [Fusarium avenaceum]